MMNRSWFCNQLTKKTSQYCCRHASVKYRIRFLVPAHIVSYSYPSNSIKGLNSKQWRRSFWRVLSWWSVQFGVWSVLVCCSTHGASLAKPFVKVVEEGHMPPCPMQSAPLTVIYMMIMTEMLFSLLYRGSASRC